MMRSPVNQNHHTRGQRNRGESVNQSRRFLTRFVSKTKCDNSFHDVNRVLFLSTHKRSLSIPEQLETKKRKKEEVHVKHIHKSTLQHKFIVFCEYGCNVSDE